VAFNNRLIEVNPMANIPRPKQTPKHEKHSLSEVQEKNFVNACLSNLEKYEPYLILLLQGLRKGEMLALKPNDFDFENNTLRIDESYNEQFPDDTLTKNATSNRVMPMFALTRQILLKYKDYENKDERIYKMKSMTLLQRLAKLLKENDLPHFTMHELRHTFISRCHDKNIDEIVVQKWVGHTIGSPMTKAVYTHIANEKELAYIDLLNN
jgi:integrase